MLKTKLSQCVFVLNKCENNIHTFTLTEEKQCQNPMKHAAPKL